MSQDPVTATAGTRRRIRLSLPDETLIKELGVLPDGVELLRWDLAGAAPAAHIDVVVPPYLSRPEILRALDGVTTLLVQGQSIGYDGVKEALPRGHVYANAATVHEASAAELAVALVLAVQRGIPDFVRAGAEGAWAPSWRPSLADRRVLLLGYGGLGKAIEARLVPFEVDLVRVGRTARSDANGPIHGIGELPELLANCEVVIVSVPLSAETEHLIDDSFLAALPDGALVVNVARGKVGRHAGHAGPCQERPLALCPGCHRA